MPQIDSNLTPVPVNNSAQAVSAPVAAPAAAPTSMGADSTHFSASKTPPTSADVSAAATAAGVSLTDEETKFITQGLLAIDYPALKAAYQKGGIDASRAIAYGGGLKGPYAGDWGNPNDMLNAARQASTHPELLRMYQNVKKGDIVLIAYNDPHDLIAAATKGPFAHVMICTGDGPPPQFIEAIGMTGSQSDPTANRVRRTTIPLGSHSSYRVISPASALSEPRRSEAIDQAVAYAEKNLGKPYDYTFGNTDQGRSFFCSSLAYYAYEKGARLHIPLEKSSQRDSLILAMGSMLNALAPKDRDTLMTKIMTTVNSRPKPTADQLTKFIVEQVLPATNATANITKTPEDRVRMEVALKKFESGQGLPRTQLASRHYADAKNAGRFKTPVIGFIRRTWDQLRIGNAALSDVYHAFDGSGMSKWQTLKAARRLLMGLMPYSETLSAFIFGKHDSKTRTFGRILNVTGWFRSHKPISWVSGWMPLRATNAIDKQFVSPTDLAWAKASHTDYNLRPGQNLDHFPAA
jgi:cell wall-associated NlpC family hydrolase